MRYLISTICIALLLWGCDITTAVPATPKPKVVRKKIVAPKDNTANVRTKKTVRTAATKPDAKPQTKTDVAKVDKTQAKAKIQPTVKEDANSRQLIVKKVVTKSIENKQPNSVKPKKPTISPKSEITAIKPKVKPDGAKTVAGKKPEAAILVAASNTLPDGTPAKYDATGKVDPFEPLFQEKQAVAKKSDKKIKRVPRTPLERIDLSQLKLVGIILASSGNRALVEESTGKGYIIKKGTYIGIDGGKIVNINKEIVYVEEKFEDGFGKIQTRKRELKLPKPPGEF